MKSILALGALATICCAGAAQAFVLEPGCPPNATCATVEGEVIGSGDNAVVYLAVNNAGPEGVDLGGKTVGNGSHLLDATGEYMMDCTANEAECREALENARDSVSDGGSNDGGQTPAEPDKPEEPAQPSEPSTPPNQGDGDKPEAQVYTDGSAIYFIGGAQLYFVEGKLVFRPGR